MTDQTTPIESTSAGTDRAAPAELAPNTVELANPIKRGDSSITHVTLRKPRAGELRGLSLSALLELRVEALQSLVPRISSPVLHSQDVANLEPSDLVSMGGVVIDFLLTRAQKAEFLSA